MNAGIDYGMGLSNIDRATGIRYGCINQNTVSQAWCESSEPQYGPPACPECGAEVVEVDYDRMEGWSHYRKRGGCDDYACENCEHTLSNDDVYGDEPIAWTVDDGEYQAEDCLDHAIIITKSPYYTYAPFCSPCVPGAGDLDSAGEGVKAYCLGHDWFDEGVAPYPIYNVDNDEKVEP